MIGMRGISRTPTRMLPDHPLQTTLLMDLSKDVSVGMRAAWKERDSRKTRVASLGKYLTEADATSFAIGMY